MNVTIENVRSKGLTVEEAIESLERRKTMVQNIKIQREAIEAKRMEAEEQIRQLDRELVEAVGFKTPEVKNGRIIEYGRIVENKGKPKNGGEAEATKEHSKRLARRGIVVKEIFNTLSTGPKTFDQIIEKIQKSKEISKEIELPDLKKRIRSVLSSSQRFSSLSNGYFGNRESRLTGTLFAHLEGKK